MSGPEPDPYAAKEPGEQPGTQPGFQPWTPPPTPPTQPPGGYQPYGAGQSPYPGYPQQPGYPQPAYPPAGYGYAAPPRDHPRATTALVLGLVGLVGGMACGLPILAAPFAWWQGVKARREIDAQPGLGGRGQATAGMVTGIIGTVLLVLALALLVLVVVLALTGALDDSGSSGFEGTNAVSRLPVG